MACSRPASAEQGYATPAAIVISLSLAIITTAVSERSLAELDLARADMARTQAELALDGAQQQAALALITAPRAAPQRWSLQTGGLSIDVLAEPEASKLNLALAAEMDDAALARLGVRDPDALRGRLKALLARDDDVRLGGVDAAPLWARCARSWISAAGAAVALPSARTPIGDGSGRLGEVWRIRVSSDTGWVDDRTVRFTGDLSHPARTIRRGLFKTNSGSGQCETTFAPNSPR